MNTARTTRYRKGHVAEFLCIASLSLRGFRILARRYKTPRGEIDIIAKRGGKLHFIEVKARNSEEEALAAIPPHQQKRIMAAAEIYLQSHPRRLGLAIQFDLMYLLPARLPCHVQRAWES